MLSIETCVLRVPRAIFAFCARLHLDKHAEKSYNETVKPAFPRVQNFERRKAERALIMNRLFWKGTLQVREQDGYLQPLRLTDKQLLRYQSIPRCCYPYCMSGIRLEARVQAEQISFDYLTGTIWNFGPDTEPKIDIYENGCLTEIVTVCQTNGTPAHLIYKRKDPSVPSVVTVYLPQNAEMRFANINLGENAEPTPKKETRYLILGDSISQGLMGNTASFCYTALLERFLECEMVNQSVGGDCMEQEAIDPDLPYDPTHIIIALGTNDVAFFGDYDVMIKNAASYIEKIRSIWGGRDITLITPPWLVNASETPEKYALQLKYGRTLFDMAKGAGFRAVWGEQIVPHAARFFTDHAHPNDAGFALYALNLIKALQR